MPRRRGAPPHQPTRRCRRPPWGGPEGARPPHSLELVPCPPHPMRRSHAVELDSCPQVRLCASRSAPAAADGPPASLASLPPPPPPPPPSPPSTGAAKRLDQNGARVAGVRPARVQRKRTREAPGRPPLGRAHSSGHPRPHQCRLEPRSCVSAALVVQECPGQGSRNHGPLLPEAREIQQVLKVRATEEGAQVPQRPFDLVLSERSSDSVSDFNTHIVHYTTRECRGIVQW